MTLFRRDQLVEVTVPLGAKPADAIYLPVVENPTAAQRAAYFKWLQAPLGESDHDTAPAPV